MLSKCSFLSLLLLVLLCTSAFATEPAATLARKAISEQPAESTPAIEELRSLGPTGLQTLLTTYDAEIQQHIANPRLTSPEWQRISKALDTVSQQKNSFLSGLFWYTDLQEAKKVASKSDKPILSLRLLGKLTEELSCANSRYFRTVLYPDAEVSAFLREHFVLHWQSVRPAPVITIDFGDGRKLESTITGNSIHYVLDSKGRLIEAFPGLYGPKAFLRGLTSVDKFFASTKEQKDEQVPFMAKLYQQQRMTEINSAWTLDTSKIGGKLPRGFSVTKDGNGEAMAIMPLAITKSYSEVAMLRSITQNSELLGRVTDEDAWRKIADLHTADAVLDERSVSLIKRQNASLSDSDFNKMLQRFQSLIALDTVRNEYMLHTKLYPWLMSDPSRNDLAKFNDKVYAELFLTPGSDPWLGLLTPDAYTATENRGIKN